MSNYSSWGVSTDFDGSLNCQACASYTCQNGGTCNGGENQLFTCTCATGFTGVNCQTSSSNNSSAASYASPAFLFISFLSVAIAGVISFSR